ncbi:MAG: tRNA-modifying protein YgfZ [Candidatus Omnitrophica bacterium]|nr:tRNA-modifying protein YgfZ [Candidatus Omnitrophota bacterium]
MRLYTLNQSVLLFQHKAREFLNAYTSNAPEASKNAFLDIRGRIVAVCDQRFLSADEVMMVLERPFQERLLKHLEKYLALGDTTVVEKADQVYFDMEKGQMIISPTKQLSTVSENEWTLYRLRHFMPAQGIDYDQEMLLNVFDEAYVSYTKGCYLGQEVIARVHYRGKPPKKLVVKTEDQIVPGDSPMTSQTTDPATGKAMGFVFTVLK